MKVARSGDGNASTSVECTGIENLRAAATQRQRASANDARRTRTTVSATRPGPNTAHKYGARTAKHAACLRKREATRHVERRARAERDVCCTADFERPTSGERRSTVPRECPAGEIQQRSCGDVQTRGTGPCATASENGEISRHHFDSTLVVEGERLIALSNDGRASANSDGFAQRRTGLIFEEGANGVVLPDIRIAGEIPNATVCDHSSALNVEGPGAVDGKRTVVFDKASIERLSGTASNCSRRSRHDEERADSALRSCIPCEGRVHRHRTAACHDAVCLRERRDYHRCREIDGRGDVQNRRIERTRNTAIEIPVIRVEPVVVPIVVVPDEGLSRHGCQSSGEFGGASRRITRSRRSDKRTDGKVWRHRHSESRISSTVCRDDNTAYELPALGERGAADYAGKKFQRECGVRQSSIRAGDSRRCTAIKCAEHGEIEEVIRTCIRIARIVRGHSVPAEINADSGITENRVSTNRGAAADGDIDACAVVVGYDITRSDKADLVLCRGVHEYAVRAVSERGLPRAHANQVADNLRTAGRRPGDFDADSHVPGDDVPVAAGANDRPDSTEADENSRVISNCCCTRGVRTDVVSKNRRACRSGALNCDARKTVARNDVSRTRRVATDEDICSAEDGYADVSVAKIEHTRGVGADEIALDDRRGRAREVNQNTNTVERRGDDVAFASVDSADDCAAALRVDSVKTVAEHRVATGIRANVVAANDGSVRPGQNLNAIAVIARNHVPVARCSGANANAVRAIDQNAELIIRPHARAGCRRANPIANDGAASAARLDEDTVAVPAIDDETADIACARRNQDAIFLARHIWHILPA